MAGERPNATLARLGFVACAARPTDTVYVAGAFPYDLPFYAQTSQPMVVLGNWSELRQQVGDSWQRALF